MPGTRHLMVVLCAAIWVVSACGNVAPAAQTNPPVTLAPGSGTAPTAAPSQAANPTATTPPATSAPVTAAPSQAPNPTATTPPATSAPTQPGPQPNLVISDFFVEEDPVAVGGPATLTATVTNSGSADAGRFSVEIVIVERNKPDVVLEAATYSAGLAIGATNDLTVSYDPKEVGELRVIARVDAVDEVEEADESDNEQALDIIVKSLGNLTFPADGFTVTPDPQAPGVYVFNFTLANTGTSAVDERLLVKFFAYSSAGRYVEWGTHPLDIHLPPGERTSLVVTFTVEPDSYRAYVLADSAEFVEESDETDNEAFFDFTAP